MANGQREQWGSKFGFILAATGSAVGLGNIWKFPYMAGVSGGAAFVIVYLACVLVIGIPIMLLELALGRKTQRNPVGAYLTVPREGPLQGPGSYVLGGIAGFLGVAAGFVILSFYSVVAGWCIGYIGKALDGTFSTFTSPAAAGEYFSTFAASSGTMLILHALFMAICIGIVWSGVKGGIERATKILMPALLAILLVLVVRGLTLPGSSAGIEFLFKADFSKILDGNTLLNALGHAFFTLSLGMGAMITYGSYLKRDDNLFTSGITVALLDTVVALLAGIAIFTAVFAYGLDPAAGPGLIFHVLPVVFASMPGGAAFGFLFFILLTIAAITSGISLLEVVTAYFVDEQGWKRHQAALVFGIAIFLLGVPSSLSNGGPLTSWSIFGFSFFDAADYLSFKYMLPIGGLLIAVFTLVSWGVRAWLTELEVGSGKRLSVGVNTVVLVIVCVLVMLTLWAGITGRI